MREGAIGRTGAALFLLVVCAMPAAADDLPTRKAGLWEITTGMGDRSVKMQQCVDAAAALMSPVAVKRRRPGRAATAA